LNQFPQGAGTAGLAQLETAVRVSLRIKASTAQWGCREIGAIHVPGKERATLVANYFAVGLFCSGAQKLLIL